METDDVHKHRFDTDVFGNKVDWEEQNDKIRLSPYIVVSNRFTTHGEVEVRGGIYSPQQGPFSMNISVEKCRHSDTYVALHGRRGFRCEGYFGPLLTGNTKFGVARKSLEAILRQIKETREDVVIELIQLCIDKKDGTKYYYLKIRE